MDEDVWERAKAKARERKDYDEQSGSSFYALVTAIYKRMGGRVRGSLRKSDGLGILLLLVKATPTAAGASPAQLEAGNYRKRKIRFQGLRIRVENPKGSVRSGTGPGGKTWRTKMLYHYGYILGSRGVDKDHVDCYVGPDRSASHAYVVHQRKAGDWNRYDEDKVMLGFGSEAEARRAFLAHYDDPRFLGPVTTLPMEELERKVKATADAPAMIKGFSAAHG